MAGRLNRNPGELREAFGEHVIYEIDMLRHTYPRAQRSTGNRADDNAFIEAFCIHARLLIEFFVSRKPPTDDKMAAQHFTTGQGYRAFSAGKLDRALVGRLHTQIAHLSYSRSAKIAEKIGPADRKALYDAIEAEIERWAPHLREPYATMMRNINAARVMMVNFSDTAGTTTSNTKSQIF